MISSTDKQDLEAFYSPYGYVQVSKSDYDSSSNLITFTKEGNISGSINVTKLLLNKNNLENSTY